MFVFSIFPQPLNYWKSCKAILWAFQISYKIIVMMLRKTFHTFTLQNCIRKMYTYKVHHVRWFNLWNFPIMLKRLPRKFADLKKNRSENCVARIWDYVFRSTQAGSCGLILSYLDAFGFLSLYFISCKLFFLECYLCLNQNYIEMDMYLIYACSVYI